MPRRPIGKRPRRPFRRPLRGPRGARAIPGMAAPGSNGRAIPPLLLMANQAFKSGNYEEAAVSYLKLGEKGLERGLRQAANMFLKAARCYVMLGKTDLAVKLVRQVVEDLAKEERWADLYRAVKNSVHFLNERDYTTEARMVKPWAEEFIPPEVLRNLESTVKAQTIEEMKVTLPTHCPSCGGTIDPREVEWVDHSNIVCDFCGSVVRGE